MIYISLGSFCTDKDTTAFKEVAIIRHPRVGEYVFGFITSSVVLQVLVIYRFSSPNFVPKHSLIVLQLFSFSANISVTQFDILQFLEFLSTSDTRYHVFMCEFFGLFKRKLIFLSRSTITWLSLWLSALSTYQYSVSWLSTLSITFALVVWRMLFIAER